MKKVYLTTILIFVIASVGNSQNFQIDQIKSNPQLQPKVTSGGYLKKFEYPSMYQKSEHYKESTNGSIWVEDSSYSYIATEGDWELIGGHEILQRDGFGNPLTSLIKDFDGNNWGNTQITHWSYYDDNQEQIVYSLPWNSNINDWGDTSKLTIYKENGWLDMKFTKQWDEESNTFIEGEKHVYSFGSNQYWENLHIYNWDTLDNGWELDRKIIFEVNNLGLIIELIVQEWDEAQNEFVNNLKGVYSYNAMGQDSLAFEYIWDQGSQSWENLALTEFTYNDEGLINNVLFNIWDDDLEDWINTGLLSYSYTTFDELSLMLRQSWDDQLEIWENVEQTVYEYQNELWYSRLSQTWDQTSQNWFDERKLILDYDDNNNMILEIQQINFGEGLEDYVKSEFFWSEFETSGIEDIVNNFSFSVSPNPAQNEVSVNIAGAYSTQPFELKIYSLTGRLVKTAQVNSGNALVNIADLNTGIYFMELSNNRCTFVRKLIKEL